MNVPYQAIIVGTNEVFKKILRQRKVELSFSTYFACASVAGFIASCATMPLDNVRTRINTQCDLLPVPGCPQQLNCLCTNNRQGVIKYKNSLSTAREIMRSEGAHGFFKGLVPRSITQSLATAVSWSSYEVVKSLLGVERPRH